MKKSSLFIAIVVALGAPGCAVDTDPGGGNIAPESVEKTVKAGGTVSSGDVDSVSSADPVETSVTSPNGGVVKIEEVPLDRASEPDDYEFFGQQIEITAPDATAEDPLVLEFGVHRSVLPEDSDETTVQMFRNGAMVAPGCTGAEGVAEPDPCMSERSLEGLDLRMVALTSKSSLWSFGTPRVDFVPDSKGEVDIDKLKDGEWPVILDGDTGTVKLPFSKAVPGEFLPSDDSVLGSSVTLVVRSDQTGATANLTSGKLVTHAPTKAGEWTVDLNADRTEATLTFQNEAPGGLTLKPGLSYEVQITISTNDYLESLSASTFTVVPE